LGSTRGRAAGDAGGAGVGRWWRLPLLATALAAGIWWLPRLPPLAERSRRAFLVDPARLEIAQAPAWFGGSVEGSLRDALERLSPAPLRSDEEIRALTHELAAASGWIGAIERVEKRYPNRLEVEFSLRRPIALLESERGLLLADAAGIVVSRAADAADYLERHELPLVNAPRPLRAVAPGAAVSDPAIEEGLRVAQELGLHGGMLASRGLRIEVIDVTAAARSGGRALTEVELYTRDGLAIEWGRSSGHPRFGALEPAPEAKIRGLLRVAARHPGFAGVRRVRLQFDSPYVVLDDPSAPLAGGPSAP